ncbi:ABC transporter substrate-binding protein [Halomonas salinarum]|uniref:ABC transporter substrate-binding protein n=1 Tax=Halomonas salinarum TaxID=1158993 RepID=UPI00143A05E5|nr:ABC transporter substrate-binding protein [Halomonas salinarum]
MQEQASSQTGEAPAEVPAPSSSDETSSDTPQTGPEEKGSAVGSEEAEALIVEVPSVAKGSPEPIEPPPTRELHLVLDWYPSLHHAAVLIAKAHGELKRQGVSLTITSPADPRVPAKLVAAERADLAMGRQPQLHMLIDEGLPLVRVATLIDTPLSSLIVREDSDITTFTDLAGKTLGYAFKDSITPILASMLNHHGMSLNDVKLEKLDFDMVRALTEKRVDAVIGAPRNVIPALLAQEGVPSRRFLAEEHGLPLHDGLILIANRDRLDGKRDDIKHFLTALEEATNWTLNHPDKAWALLVQEEPSLDSTANRQAWEATLRRMAPSPGTLNAGRYDDFEKFLEAHSFIDKSASVKRLAVEPGAT